MRGKNSNIIIHLSNIFYCESVTSRVPQAIKQGRRGSGPVPGRLRTPCRNLQAQPCSYRTSTAQYSTRLVARTSAPKGGGHSTSHPLFLLLLTVLRFYQCFFPEILHHQGHRKSYFTPPRNKKAIPAFMIAPAMSGSVIPSAYHRLRRPMPSPSTELKHQSPIGQWHKGHTLSGDLAPTHVVHTTI